MKKSAFPSCEEIAAVLKILNHDEMQEVADRAGMPFGTIAKIRTGEVKNPGIETVRKFYPIMIDLASRKLQPVIIGIERVAAFEEL